MWAKTHQKLYIASVLNTRTMAPHRGYRNNNHRALTTKPYQLTLTCLRLPAHLIPNAQ